jgi:3'(2'), 5'-bisphosphate nucleotidase
MFLKAILQIIQEAGQEILKIYNSSFKVDFKKDKTPLTEADKCSHKIIEQGLKKISNYPILSEEGTNIPYEQRKSWDFFWLIDPLDGTKEFIKRNGEFTVNIALIHKNKPVLGVVYAPAKEILYYGGKEIGAYKIEKHKELKLLPKAINTKEKIKVVVSRSHLNKETENFIKLLSHFFKKIETVSIGSSLKICLIAEGKADLYPRMSPTKEWDTAAAHAILNAVGGKLVKFHPPIKSLKELKTLSEIEYNKENLLNPYFVAFRKNVF